MITVELPSALQPYAAGSHVVELERPCAMVRDALAAVAERWPGVRDRVVDEQGAVRPHVNVFVNEDNARFRGGLDAPLADGSRILIVPAVSGG